jgi:hypothetical protein
VRSATGVKARRRARAACQNGGVGKVLLLAIWIVAAAAVGVVGLALYEVRRSRAPTSQAIAIERMPSRQNHHPSSRWTLTEHLSAHSMLVAHIETLHLGEAVAIAQQLVEPAKGRYEEVLIYFHRPGRPDTLPPRRVQWTLKTGYVETVYE